MITINQTSNNFQEIHDYKFRDGGDADFLDNASTNTVIEIIRILLHIQVLIDALIDIIRHTRMLILLESENL